MFYENTLNSGFIDIVRFCKYQALLMGQACVSEAHGPEHIFRRVLLHVMVVVFRISIHARANVNRNNSCGGQPRGNEFRFHLIPPRINLVIDFVTQCVDIVAVFALTILISRQLGR